MTGADIARQRLAAQCLLAASAQRPEDVVSWLSAVQAQEYGPSRWALGLRLATELGDGDVEAAFDEGRLVRTHVLRPTWHFVAPADLRWMLALTAPRIRGSMAAYDRSLEIDGVLLRRARRIIERSLASRTDQTRAELGEALLAGGIEATGSRLAHVMLHAELDALVCSGPRRGRQFTYALVDQRVPAVPAVAPDEALEALVVRYFTSHGPATLRDFAWWCGLRTSEARRILEARGAVSRDLDGLRYWWFESAASATKADGEGPCVHLLPIYDEYTVAYRDRVAVPHGAPIAMGGAPKSLVFHHTLAIDGQLAGTWRPTPEGGRMSIDVQLLRRADAAERRAIRTAAEAYGRFVGATTRLRLT